MEPDPFCREPALGVLRTKGLPTKSDTFYRSVLRVISASG